MNHVHVRKRGAATLWLLLACGWFLAAFSSPVLACDERYSRDENPTHYVVSAYCPTMKDAWDACKSFTSAHGFAENACGNYPGRGYYEVGRQVPSGEFYSGYFSAPSSPPPNPAKNAGPPPCDCQTIGDPINTGNGNKFESKLEYRGEGAFPLWFEWTYNFIGWESVPSKYRPIGFKRTFNYGSRLSQVTWALRYVDTIYTPAIVISRPDGKEEQFHKNNSLNRWVAQGGAGSRLFELAGTAGWRFEAEDGYVELFNVDGKLIEVQDGEGRWQRLSYNASGQLAEVVDMQGRALKFEHNTAGRLARLLLPEGGALTFTYTTNNDYLTKVAYQDNSAVEYLYDEAANRPGGGYVLGALTGVLDEDKVRYSSTYYTADRASRTHLSGNLDDYTATYQTGDGRITYVQANLPGGATRKLNLGWTNGRIVPAKIVTTCTGCAERTIEYTYDANSREDVVTHNGVVTDFDYDDRGLLTQQIEAKTDTAGNRRTTQTDWHPDFRAPAARRVYDAANVLVTSETWTYNTRGQELTHTQLDVTGSAPSRTTSTNYCEQPDVDAGRCPILGLRVLVDGPRTDVADTVRYTYYAADDSGCTAGPATCGHRKGDVWKVTNALGQAVLEAKRFDGAGRLQSSVDGNGVTTDYEYHPRGWLAAIKVRGADSASETDDRIIHVTYRPTGLVERITLPDGEYLRYAYDTAHRLTDVIDQAGNTLHYTLNSSGDRLQEDVKTTTGTLKRTMSRVYNLYGELSAIKDAANNPTGLTYDGLGNPDRTTDALGRVIDQDYDPLRRLVRSMQDANGLKAQTDVKYNARNQITQITDPNRLSTFYRYNGFGEQIQLESPDTSITDYGYDTAGLLATKKDANDATAHRYTYDALSRPKAIFYTASGPADVEYDYDTINSMCASGETFALGHVTAMRADGTELKYCYDRFGQVVRKVQTVGTRSLTLQYAYTLGGQLQAMTYPDGAVVDYVRDPQGRIQEIGVKPTSGACQTYLCGGVGAA